MRERITKAGYVYLLAVLMVGLAAFLSANNLLFLLLAAMLATLLVSGFVSRLGVSNLALDLTLPDHVCARRPTPATLQLANLKSVFPSFSLHLTGIEDSVFASSLYFPVIAGGLSMRENVTVRFARRGRHEEDGFQISSRFPFGFAERRVRLTIKREVLVYPALDPQPGFEALRSGMAEEADARVRGMGQDFYRIRPYAPFESARHVDWRATAHTGQLQVREFARELDPMITIALDLETPPESIDWFERAIECCAFLSWNFSLTPSQLRFRTQDFDLLCPAQGDVYAILKYLALAEPRRRAHPLEPIADESIQVLFTARPAHKGDSLWASHRVVSPITLPGPTAASTGPRQDHN
jgi:uncharacterized protein (DUF58 family)